MPVRLIVTNNVVKSLSPSYDARILFYTAGGDRINAAEPEDVERLMTRTEREGKKIPMPGPLPSIKMKPKASNKDIEQDFDQFEYQALVVEPHTTRAGFFSMMFRSSIIRCRAPRCICTSCAIPTATSSSFSRFPSTGI